MDSDVRRLIVAEIPHLRRYALFMVHNSVEADDLVQECLLRAIDKIATWEPGTNLRAWLRAILHNRVMTHLRYVKRRPIDIDSLHGSVLAVPGNHDRNLLMQELARGLSRLN